MFHTVVPHSQKLDTDGSNYFPPAFKTSFVQIFVGIKSGKMGKRQLGIASDEDLVGNVWQYGKLLEVRLPSFIVFLSLFCVHYYICLENLS